MDRADTGARIRFAASELARVVLKKDELSQQTTDRLLRLLRPAGSRGCVELVSPIKSKIRNKLVREQSRNGNESINHAAQFDQDFELTKVLLSKSSPYGSQLLYSFLQVSEPQCCSMASASSSFFNSTISALEKPGKSSFGYGGGNHASLNNSATRNSDPPPSRTSDPGFYSVESNVGNGKGSGAEEPQAWWLSRDVELNLLRDLLYIFQGVTGKYIKYDQRGEFYVLDPSLNLRQSVKDIILSLCEIGWLYNKVESFLNKTLLQPATVASAAANGDSASLRLMMMMMAPAGSNASSGGSGSSAGGEALRGLVPQAFAYAIQEELHDYYRLLAVLELELSKNTGNKVAASSQHGLIRPALASGAEYSGLTLLRLQTWMQQPFDRLYYIARLVDATSALSGGALVSRLHSYALHGDTLMSAFLQRMMTAVCAPIYSMIAKWILYGELQDPYNEFFIGCRAVGGPASGEQQHMWNEMYFIRPSMLPSFIPLSLAKQIFLIGKSINFLSHCRQKLSTLGSTGTKENDPSSKNTKISSSNYNQRYHNKGGSHNRSSAKSTSGNNRKSHVHFADGVAGAVLSSGKRSSKVKALGSNPPSDSATTRIKRVVFTFGRKHINRAGMARPSVADAMGFRRDEGVPLERLTEVENEGFISSADSASAVGGPIEPSGNDESLVSLDPLEDFEEDYDNYQNQGGDDSEEEEDDDEFSDVEATIVRHRGQGTSSGSDTDSSCDDEDYDEEFDKDITGDGNVVSSWLLSDKELEMAIKNLQYNNNIATFALRPDTDESTTNKTQFEEWIIRISANVDRRLLWLLESRFYFTTHLAALKKFILLGQGDFVICLMDSMGQELKKRANQLYRHNLTSLLEGALRSSNAQYEPSFVLDRIGIRLLDAQPGDTGWEIFSLDYTIDFPLTAVIHANALTKYHVIFHMLWRLKRVEWVLADSWKQLMEFKRKQGLAILPKLNPIFHKCTLYRSRMLHVINNLSAFLMFEVLETAWHKLQTGIQEKANNMDDIINLHDNYLDEILRKALLIPAYETLNMQVQQVIQTVLRFCGLEDALIFDANASMQRKRSMRMDMENTSVLTGKWGVIDESLLDNPIGTIEGVPENTITRLEDAFADFNLQLSTLMTMLNDQGGDIGEFLRFLTFRLDYNNFLSNQPVSASIDVKQQIHTPISQKSSKT